MRQWKEVEDSERMMGITHISLKENTWLFRIGLEVVSTDHQVFVYKVVNLVWSSLSSSLV